MSQQGKVQLVIVVSAPPDQVAEGDRIFENHAKWMEDTHPRAGDKALLRYNLSKAPELSNPMDPTSAPTGNTSYVLAEVYETAEGVENHFRLANELWSEFPAFQKWLGAGKVTMVTTAPIEYSLW